MALIFWKLSEKINFKVDPPRNRSDLATQFFGEQRLYNGEQRLVLTFNRIIQGITDSRTKTESVSSL